MSSYPKLSVVTIAAIFVLLSTAVAQSPAQPHYLITNNDFSQGNSASFYRIASDGALGAPRVVSTGGTGVNGVGAVGTKRVSLLKNST